jgi:hypothetical protein
MTRTTANTDRKFSTTELKEAGASDEFISVYLSAVPSTAKEELNTGFGGEVLEDGGNPCQIAGGWFTKLWTGKLFWALCHADNRNAAALAEVFDRRDFVEDGVDSEGEPLDYVERMVDDRLPEQ